MEIFFLGTGIPIPNTKRVGQGILISHEETSILFDIGPGVNRRIIESNLKYNEIDYLFLTHLHWDHFGDYDALVQTGFVSDRKESLRVFGPHGVKEVSNLLFERVYSRDLIYRSGIRGPNDWKNPLVTEVFGGDNINIGPFKVKVFRVHHGEYVDYSLAYRIDCGQQSIVISGDTAPVIGFSEFAKDCDILIHEVMPGKPPSQFLIDAHPNKSAEELVNMMGHSSPRQVGEVAHSTNAKNLILNHLPPEIPSDLKDKLAENYNKNTIISEDLMKIKLQNNGEIVYE